MAVSLPRGTCVRVRERDGVRERMGVSQIDRERVYRGDEAMGEVRLINRCEVFPQ